MEQIRWIVEAIAAAGAFIGAVSVVVRPIRAMLKAQREHQDQAKKRDESIMSRLDILERHQRETWMEGLRDRIFSNSLPLTERIDAGKVYISNGGNGIAEVQHEENVRRLREAREQEGAAKS